MPEKANPAEINRIIEQYGECVVIKTADGGEAVLRPTDVVVHTKRVGPAWTSEPWSCQNFAIYGYGTPRRTLAHTGGQDIRNNRECEANAARIVACVNALAGIEDPAEFVARAKAAFERGDQYEPLSRIARTP